jgi:hypothetical protein
VSVGYPAITDLIGADPVADPDSGSKSAGGAAGSREESPVTRSHGGAFADRRWWTEEWSAAAGIG